MHTRKYFKKLINKFLTKKVRQKNVSKKYMRYIFFIFFHNQRHQHKSKNNKIFIKEKYSLVRIFSMSYYFTVLIKNSVKNFK